MIYNLIHQLNRDHMSYFLNINDQIIYIMNVLCIFSFHFYHIKFFKYMDKDEQYIMSHHLEHINNYIMINLLHIIQLLSHIYL